MRSTSPIIEFPKKPATEKSASDESNQNSWRVGSLGSPRLYSGIISLFLADPRNMTVIESGKMTNWSWQEGAVGAHDRFPGTLFRSFRRTRQKGNHQPKSGM